MGFTSFDAGFSQLSVISERIPDLRPSHFTRVTVQIDRIDVLSDVAIEFGAQLAEQSCDLVR